MEKSSVVKRLSSYAEGKWHVARGNATPLFHAVTGEAVAESSSDGLDFHGVLRHARNVGGSALRKLTFHQRGELIRKIALLLTDKKELFYEKSWPTGATRGDAWIDIDGGIGTLFTYASKARRELPDQPFYIDGELERLSRDGTFVGRHICVPLEGAAVHINAFNFPCWGMLEKLAPTILAGVPAIIKPATQTSYVTEAVVREIIASGILPEGALQLICGATGDLFDHLTCQDIVTLTGSKDTGLKLKQHSTILKNSVRFNLEADSLNCTILGPDVTPEKAEFSLFINEIVKEMTVKAGQKCTAIRRILVPKAQLEPVTAALRERLQKIVIGDPSNPAVQMGPLASRAQVTDVKRSTEQLLAESECLFGDLEQFSVTGADRSRGAFFAPILLAARKPEKASAIHSVEAFGPVATVMSYATLADAIKLSQRGDGSLVASVFSHDDSIIRELALGLAPYHGRLLLMSEYCSRESTGHGSPLPHLVHGGPGRAGGGEELGGIRSVLHYMQRTALQGSPQTLTRVCGVFQRGATPQPMNVHPFRKYFEELVVGETFFSAEREMTREDVEKFADLSGDRFYVHMDEAAARASQFGERIVHGYLVLAAAAGLFVDPAPGPVIANYGLERLRFITPVKFGDRIKVRLTCKQKLPRGDEPQGVVHWDVEVTNQRAEAVAVYTVLTLVKRRQTGS